MAVFPEAAGDSRAADHQEVGKMIRSKNFFSENDKILIKNAISSVEKVSASEIVVMTADESCESTKLIVTISSVLSVAAVFLAMILFPVFADKRILLKLVELPFQLNDAVVYILAAGATFFIPVFLFVFFILYFFLKYCYFWKRIVFSTKMKLEAVERKALKMFYENGLQNTRDRTGVLIFFSVMERKLFIIADIGINSKLSSDELNGYALSIGDGLRHKRGGEAIAGVISALGAKLAQHFPVKPDDTNELSDEVISHR